MKAVFTSGFLLLALASLAAPAPPRLAGIVHTPKFQMAILEVAQERRNSKWPMLRIGERDGDCEIVSIDPNLGAVTLLWGRQRLEMRLPSGEDIPSSSALHLHNADMRVALELYQMLSGRTIIRSPSMVIAPVNVRTSPTLADADCASAIEKVVKEQGLIFKARGTVFTFVVAANEEKRVDAIADPPGPGDPARDEVFPPGFMKFVDADIVQVLDVYSALIGRTVLQPHWSHIRFRLSVRSQSALSRSQAAWLLEAAMALGDLSIVPRNETFVFAVPTELADGDTFALLERYAAVVGRNPLTNDIPNSRIRLNCKKPLAAGEVFALEATAALNNLAFEFVEPNSVILRPAAAVKKKETEGKR